MGSRGEGLVLGVGDFVPRSWDYVPPEAEASMHIIAYIRIHFASTWKDMAPLKLFQLEIKAAVYAFQQLLYVHIYSIGCDICCC